MSVTMARPKPLKWEHEVIGRRYRIGEEHPKFKGWYFSGAYTHEGRALWSRPPSRLQRWLRYAGWALAWVAGVLLVMLICAWVFGGLVPALLQSQ
jgi:hypothetical protein